MLWLRRPKLALVVDRDLLALADAAFADDPDLESWVARRRRELYLLVWREVGDREVLWTKHEMVHEGY